MTGVRMTDAVGSDRLLADLRALGVSPGDTLMVHVSMRRIGPLEGGARGLVEVIDRAVGASGTVLVALGALDAWSSVNEEPEVRCADLLAGSPPFDAVTTPADPDVGVFAEVFRTTPGTQVSDHPEGRFGARGAAAEILTRDVPWHHYYGPGSPLDRFVTLGGRVLRLGADDDHTTVIHLAEYAAPLSDKRAVRRHRLVRGEDGPVIRTIECLDDSDGIADYDGTGGDDEFGVIWREYRATDRVAVGTVGNAVGELADAADLVDFASRWIASHARVAPCRR